MESKNKYSLIKNLCWIVWNLSKDNNQTNESSIDLSFCDHELASKVNAGFKRWELNGKSKEITTTIEETLEAKRIYIVDYVLNDIFRRNSNRINFLMDFYHLYGVYEKKMDIPKENLDYITSLIIFHHLIHKENIILSNTSLDYCEILVKELFKEYQEQFDVVKIPRRNLKQGKKLIFDPLKYLDNKDGFVLDLNEFNCFQEELPESIKRMGL